MNQVITVNLSARSVLVTLAILLGAYVATLIPGILVMLLVALIISAAMIPGVLFFQERLGWPRIAAVLAMFGGIFGALFLLGLIVTPSLMSQSQELARDLPVYSARVRSAFTWVQGLEERFTFLPSVREVGERAASLAAGWLTSTLGLAGKVVGGVATMFILLLTTFFILLDGPGLKAGLLSLIPPRHRELWGAQFDPIALKLGAYVQGVLISISFLTFYLGVALSIAGVPLALVLALLAGLMEIIPLVGSLLGSIPAILIALTVSWQLALVVVGIFLLGNFLQGNFVQPYVFSKSIEVSPVMVIFALLIGAQLMGFAGALIAVPLMATLQVLIQNLWVDPQEREQALSESTKLKTPVLPAGARLEP